MILAFEPAEAVRNLGYLKKDGIVIVNRVPVKPVTESLQDTGYDGTEMIAYLQKKCGCIVIDAENLCTVWLVAIFQHCHLRRGSWKRTAWNQQGNRACRA